MRVQESTELAVPIERVWEFVVDPVNDPRWCPKVVAVEPAGVGRWTVLHKPMPLRPAVELAFEHLEAQPPQRLTMREEDEASVVFVEYRLAPTASGTHLTQTSEVEWKRFPGFLHGALHLGVRHDVRKQLSRLRRVLE